MRSCQKRLLFVAVISLCVAGYLSVSMSGVTFAGGTTGGGSTGYGDDGGYGSGSSDDGSSDHGSHDDNCGGHWHHHKHGPKHKVRHNHKHHYKPHDHWRTSGNKYINPCKFFLGTIDESDLAIRTDNIERVRITAEGNIGIGTCTPTGTLHVEGGSADGTADGTDITIHAQDGGPDGGAGGNIVLKPGIGSGFVTDGDGNPIQATDEDGSPLFEDDGSGNLIPVFVPNSGNVIIDGNLAPSSGHAITLGTPELRYSGIYLASWFKYDTDGLYFYYTADERTPVDYFHARFTVDSTPYTGGDGWTYFNVDPERSGNFIISPDALFESPLGTEKLQVDGDVMSTGNIDAVSFTGDGSGLTGSTAAVTAEVSARSAADVTLQNNITAEETARLAAVAASDGAIATNTENITSNEGDITALQGADTAEALARTNADDAEVIARDAAIAAADSAEEADRIAADGVLQANINAEAGLRSDADDQEVIDRDAAIAAADSAEEADRIAADGVLQANINAEALARANKDTEHTDDIASNLASIALDTDGSPTNELQNLGAATLGGATGTELSLGIVGGAGATVELGGIDTDTHLTAGEVAGFETDPDYNGSVASGITNAGSGVVMSAAERTTLGTALQSESDPTVPANIKDGVDWTEVAAIPADIADGDDVGITVESDPDYNGSVASGITNAGSGVVMSAAERTTLGTALQSETDPTVPANLKDGVDWIDINVAGLPAGLSDGDDVGITVETDPDYNGSVASTITNAGSNEVITGAERTAIGTNAGNIATNTTDIITNATSIGNNDSDISALQGEDTGLQSQITLNDTDIIALQTAGYLTTSPYTGSAASTITDAGSGVVITGLERAALGTALQTETDPTVTLSKLEGLVVDFHTLGGVDQFNDADASASNELNTGLSLSGTTLNLTDAGGSLTADLSSLALGHFSDSGEAGGADRILGNTDDFGLGLMTNNVDRLHILNAGNVGIGTTTPLAPFHVDTSATFPTLPLFLDNSIEHKTGAGISMRKSRGTPLSKSIVNNDDFLGGIQLYGYDGAAYQLAANIRGVVDGAPGLGNMPGRLIFNTNNGTGIFERMRIDNSGNVGIGTDSPGSKLTVKGDGVFLDDNSKSRVEIASDTVTDLGAWIDVKNTSGTEVAYIGMDDGGATGSGTGFMGVGEGLVYPGGHPYEGEGIDRVNIAGSGHVIVNNSSGNGLVNVFANDWSALGPVAPYGFIELHDHNGNRDSSVPPNLLPPTITLNGENGEINATRFVGDGSALTNVGVNDADISMLGYVKDQAGIIALGFETGVHTVDTTLNQAGVEGLGFEAGPHTSDADITSMGYIKGYVELDPLYIASPAAGIDQAKINEWNAHTMDITDNTAAIDLNAVDIGFNSDAIAADADTDDLNELNTGLSLSGTTLNLTDAGGLLTADLSGLSLGDFSNLGEAGGADRVLGNTDAFGLGLMTNNIDRLHILNDGKVGIGTASPVGKLDVSGVLNLLASGDSMQPGSLKLHSDNYLHLMGGTSGFKFYDDTGASEHIVIDNSGNVGIGTTSSTDKLTVAGNIVPSVTDTHTLGTSGNVWKDVYVGNSSLHIGGTTLSNVGGILKWNSLPLGIWSQNGTSAYYNDGKVGIGTTTPATELDVSGTITSTGLIVPGGSIITDAITTNTFLGDNAGSSITTGDSNTAIGSQSLIGNTTGVGNVAFGSLALSDNVDGYYNTAIGTGALDSNTGGSNNTATGRNGLKLNTTGSWNTANGFYALLRNTIGKYNNAFGSNSLLYNTEGDSNSAFGNNALYSNTIGNNNVALGGSALNSNTTGSANTANGYYALGSHQTGHSNTAIGTSALSDGTVGDMNTAIGRDSGRTAIGSGSVFLGYEAGYSEQGDNKLHIGNSRNNTLIYGEFDNGNVGIGTTSPNSRLDVSGDIRIHENDIFLRGGTDTNHGLGWYGTGINGRLFDGNNVDGPVLYGFTGGALGTNRNGTQKQALSWNSDGNVGIGTNIHWLNKISITKTIGSNDMSAKQHETQMAIFGPGDKSMALGVMDDGKGMIQVKEVNTGYNSLCLNPVAGNVGIGDPNPSEKLTVAGTIESTSGGVKFPDGTTQTTAADVGNQMLFYQPTSVQMEQVVSVGQPLLLPRAGAAHSLKIRVSYSINFTGVITVVVRKNGGNTVLGRSFSVGETGVFDGLGGPVSFNAGDLISLQIDARGASPDLPGMGSSFELTASMLY